LDDPLSKDAEAADILMYEEATFDLDGHGQLLFCSGYWAN
jgi:hypothetical protein